MQQKTALLIIDVQRGFINKHTKEIPPQAEQVQANYDLVWATRLELAKSSPFLTIRRSSGLSRIKDSAELAFNLRPDAKLIVKYGYSAATKELVNDLKTSSITSIDLMGIDTDQCVLATALALFDTGITPRIIIDRCASTGGPDAHNAGVTVLQRALGSQNLIQHTSLN